MPNILDNSIPIENVQSDPLPTIGIFFYIAQYIQELSNTPSGQIKYL